MAEVEQHVRFLDPLAAYGMAGARGQCCCGSMMQNMLPMWLSADLMRMWTALSPSCHRPSGPACVTTPMEHHNSGSLADSSTMRQSWNKSEKH